MKKIIAVLSLLLLLSPNVIAATGYYEYYPMYRVYNPESGEHYLTGSSGECFKLMDYGWVQEGVAWYAPSNGQPLYALFNPNSGEHLYTTDPNEMNTLKNVGWVDNGWYDCGGSQPVYRLYSPAASRHLYTTDENEYNTLPQFGWNQEGIAFYSVPESEVANRQL